MLTIDGAMGEGGGQILRTALALSLYLRRPFVLENIRAARPRPGLQRQHLAAVRAAAAVSGAWVEGAELGSRRLRFRPSAVRGGHYQFDIGSAGSTTLVLQTLLPALLWQTREQSRVILIGGTHNPLAPPFDFLAQTYLPLLQRMGAAVRVRLRRYGFHPAGGGRIEAEIAPGDGPRPLYLEETVDGEAVLHAEVLLSRLPHHIAEREMAVLEKRLFLQQRRCIRLGPDQAYGPGNVVMVKIYGRTVTEVFTAYGRRGVRAETVAEEAAAAASRYLQAGVPVGPYLADQLMLPLALAGGGAYLTLPPTRHTLTNMEVIRRFLEIPISCQNLGQGGGQERCLIRIEHGHP